MGTMTLALFLKGKIDYKLAENLIMLKVCVPIYFIINRHILTGILKVSEDIAESFRLILLS